jgi:hypothetical protein
MRTIGLEARQNAPLGREWQEDLRVRLSDTVVLDSPGTEATFSHYLEGDAGLSWNRGIWKLALRGLFMGQRQERSSGDALLPAYVDLRFKAEAAFSANWSVMLEGRNLLSQPVQEFSGYADPAPFVGLGATFQF